MKKKLVFLATALMLSAVPMFAQGAPAEAETGGHSWFAAAAIVAMAIAAGLCALGQGKATAGAAEAMARNPGNSARIQTVTLLGLAFMESLALYVLIIFFIAK